MLTAPLLSVVFLLTPPAKVSVPNIHWTVASVAVATAHQETIRWNQAGGSSVSSIGSSSSRGRRALIGALIGFGAGFPIGMATAGYVGDTNNPRTGMRMENGARFGALGAGIGALIGALSGKKQ